MDKMGNEAIVKEMNQLDDRGCLKPILISKMTKSEKRRAQLALAYLTEKRDGSIKGRTVFNGAKTRDWMSKEDTTSPTAGVDSIILTAMIDADEGRDVMSADVPNAFIQAEMITNGTRERVIMKIT